MHLYILRLQSAPQWHVNPRPHIYMQMQLHPSLQIVEPCCDAFCFKPMLTHWGRVTHICVGNLTIIGPDNGLSPGRRQAIIWTNAGI